MSVLFLQLLRAVSGQQQKDHPDLPPTAHLWCTVLVRFPPESPKSWARRWKRMLWAHHLCRTAEAKPPFKATRVLSERTNVKKIIKYFKGSGIFHAKRRQHVPKLIKSLLVHSAWSPHDWHWDRNHSNLLCHTGPRAAEPSGGWSS